MVVSSWGDVSHLILSLDLAHRLVAGGWCATVVGLEAVRPVVEAQGFEFEAIHPMPTSVGWTLLSHLQRCNRIRHRRGGPDQLVPEAVRSGRIVADVTLNRAVLARKESFAQILREVDADLVIWDPTELAAPAAACDLGIEHLGVNFLATPPYNEGDWWCEFMARWRHRVREVRVVGPINRALGDYIDLTPAGWGSPAPDDIRAHSVTLRPSEALFGPARAPLHSTDGLIVLSTAYRTENHVIRDLIDGVRLAGLRPVVLACRSRGAPGFERAAEVIPRAPVSALADGCGVLITAAGSHSVVSAIAGSTPAVAVPVRVHSYWEVAPAATAGIPVCPADRLTPCHLAELIANAGAPRPLVENRAAGLDAVADTICRAIN